MTRGAALFALLLVASPARAQDEPAEPTEPTMAPRAIPDYGRAPEHTDVGDALLWIPRVLFYPIHLVMEYGVREPMRWIFRTIELERIDQLFSSQSHPGVDAPPPLFGFSLRARYDHGLVPGLGLTFAARDADARYRLRVGAELWGTELVRGSVRGAMLVDGEDDADRTRVGLTLVGSHRTDAIHHGIGWAAPDSRTRYAHTFGEADLSLEARFHRRSALYGGARIGVHRFGESDYRQGGDRSLHRAIRSGALAGPPGYPAGYAVVQPWLRAVIDTREDDAHASGARVDAFGAWGLDAEVGTASSWVRVGGALELSLEILRERTLILRGLVDVVEPLGSEPVPFTEQALLGGALDRMPGFLPGRLVDHTAAVLGLAWRYAVWAWLDAELFVDVGNVFGRGLADFDVERLRLSFGTALRSPRTDDFTLLLAFGTEPFVLGTSVSSVRFALAIGAPP